MPVPTRAGRMIRADIFPIGIDVEGCQQLATDSPSPDHVRRMAASLNDRELLIGVDRLDYSKGLEERFRAYERFLRNYPANRGQVVFTQIAPRTRSGGPVRRPPSVVLCARSQFLQRWDLGSRSTLRW